MGKSTTVNRFWGFISGYGKMATVREAVMCLGIFKFFLMARLRSEEPKADIRTAVVLDRVAFFMPLRASRSTGRDQPSFLGPVNFGPWKQLDSRSVKDLTASPRPKMRMAK